MDRVEQLAYLKSTASAVFSAAGFAEDDPRGCCWFFRALNESANVSVALSCTSTIRSGVTFWPTVHFHLLEIEDTIAGSILKSQKAPAARRALRSQGGSTFACTLASLIPNSRPLYPVALTGIDHTKRLIAEALDNVVDHAIPFVLRHSSIPDLINALENPLTSENRHIRFGLLSPPVIYMLAGMPTQAEAFVRKNYFCPGRERPLIKNHVSILEYGNRILALINANSEQVPGSSGAAPDN